MCILKSYGLSIPRDKFSSVYDYLHENNLLRADLKIISRGNLRILPVIHEVNLDPYKSAIFDFTSSAENSISGVLNKITWNDDIEYGERNKWYRLGKCIILKNWKNIDEEKQAAIEIVNKFKVISVYGETGKILGEKRKPSVHLIAGKEGEIQYMENGVKYIFDPEKVMISKGNLRERNFVSRIGIKPDNVLDMFSGIGYFSLPIGKYLNPKTQTCIDVNENALNYLKKAVKLNRISSKFFIYNEDCRCFHGKMRYDLIIMGNFKSYLYLPFALRNANAGSRVILHIITPTEKILDTNYQIMERINKFGYRAIIENAHKVKSFSPHVWHVSVTVLILQTPL